MKIKLNYFVIPLITLAVALIGSWFVKAGMLWYEFLVLPPLAPPGWVIGAVWTIIFALTTISALLVWNRSPRDTRFSWLVAFFVLNAILNVLWSFLFFYLGMPLAPIAEMIVLEITVLVLIFLAWPISRLASLLLLPYALWVAFATHLAWQIFKLNG